MIWLITFWVLAVVLGLKWFYNQFFNEGQDNRNR